MILYTARSYNKVESRSDFELVNIHSRASNEISDMILKLILVIDSSGISHEIALR